MGLTRVARRAGIRQAATETEQQDGARDGEGQRIARADLEEQALQIAPERDGRQRRRRPGRRAPASCPGAAPCRGRRCAARRAPCGCPSRRCGGSPRRRALRRCRRPPGRARRGRRARTSSIWKRRCATERDRTSSSVRTSGMVTSPSIAQTAERSALAMPRGSIEVRTSSEALNRGRCQ